MHTDTLRTQPGPTPTPAVITAPAAIETAPADEPSPRQSLARVLAGIATWVILGLAVLVLATVTLGPRLGLFQVETVLSGSMEPLFEPCDLLLVVPEPLSDVRAGQVLSFHAPAPDHQVETHRVVRVIHPGAHPIILTKGDANSAADPWRARLHGTTAWRMVGVVPHAGSVIRTLREPRVHVIAVLLVPLLLAAAALRSIWRPAPKADEAG